MKKIAFIILLLLLPCCVLAQQWSEDQLARLSPAIVGGGVPVAAAGCPSGTYMFGYDSQYPADARKGCKADAVTTITGTDDDTITVDSTNGVTLDAVDEGLIFSIGATELSSDAGTVWFSVKCAATRSASVNVFLAYGSVIGTDRITSDVPTNGRMQLKYVGNGNTDTINIAAGQGPTDGQWNRVQLSWDTTLGDGSEILKIGVTGKTFTTTTTMTLDVWTTNPSTLMIGEPTATAIVTGTVDQCQVKNVFSLDGYNAADPCPDANVDGVCD